MLWWRRENDKVQIPQGGELARAKKSWYRGLPGGALDGNQLGEQHQWQYDWIPPWSKAISTRLLDYWYPANMPLDSQLNSHQTSFVSHVQLDSAIVRSACVGVCNLTISVDFEI